MMMRIFSRLMNSMVVKRSDTPSSKYSSRQVAARMQVAEMALALWYEVVFGPVAERLVTQALERVSAMAVWPSLYPRRCCGLITTSLLCAPLLRAFHHVSALCAVAAG